jgi:hypothetical protein
MKHARNPKWVRNGERDFMFRELPQNPLRIIERAAEIAKDSFLWEDVEWGIDNEGCWIRQRFKSFEGANFFEPIERDHPRHEAEVYASLRLLSSVLKDRDI